MARKPSGAADRKGKPALMPVSDDDVLGDLIDSDFSVFVEDDGKVRLHARCTDGDEAAAGVERMRFLVEALGADFVPPPELPR